MTSPALQMFNFGSGSGPFNTNNFITIYTFPASINSILEDALNSKTVSSTSIIFSPPGWVYAVSGSTPPSILFQNPLVNDSYENSYNSYAINTHKFDGLITELSTGERYYVSPVDVKNNNAGGWLLYRDGSANYYILYNPFNRPEFNFDKTTYQSYCESINFEDPGCYCTNFPETGEYPCIYDAANSKDSGQALLDTLENANKSRLSSNTISALNVLKGSSCGCLSSMCTNWRTKSKAIASDIPSMNQLPQCASNQVVNICAADIGGGSGTVKSSSSINVTQDCPGPNNLTPTVNEKASNLNKKVLIVGGAVLVLLIIIITIILIS